MRHTWIGGFLVLLLAGCVHLSESMLDQRTMVVSGRGSAFHSMGSVEKATLDDAAKKGKALGFSYFTVYQANDETSHGTVFIPGQSQTTGGATASCMGNFCNGTYSSQTVTTPSTAFGVTKPGVELHIRFYREGEIDPKTPGVWNIGSVLAVSGQ